jgi:plasmid stability protein
MGTKQKVQVWSRIHPDVRQKLEKMAARHHRTLADHIRDILTDHIEGHQECPYCKTTHNCTHIAEVRL